MTNKLIHILIVDDHQIIVDGLKMLLDNETNIVVEGTANNGREALTFLENSFVDVVLMDIEMPVLNGFDATAIITKKHPEIKVIALTTYDEKSIINEMLNAGAKGYLLKNITREILVEAINVVVEGKQYLGSDILLALAKKTNLSKKTELAQALNFSLLTNREVEVLKNIANGLTNKEIAGKLFISYKTVDTHRANIMSKLDIHSVVGLVKYAIKNGLID